MEAGVYAQHLNPGIYYLTQDEQMLRNEWAVLCLFNNL